MINHDLPANAPPPVTYGLAVGDLNGDGFEDVVEANSNPPNLIYFNHPPEN